MKTPAVFGLYGKSDAGKTTLIVELIRRLTDEGFKVASVKITDKKVSIDSEGKDTWRHTQAGSRLVVLSSKIETDFLINHSKEVDEILNHMNKLGKYDIILVEGANDKNIPKIRLGDSPERDNTILTYDGNFNEAIEIIKRETVRRKNKGKISIKINGKNIPISEFPSNIIKNAIYGMLKSLKGVDEIDEVEIYFEL